MVFDRLVSVRLGQFMERRDVLPTTKFAHRTGLCPSHASLCVTHTLQSALECGQEARIVKIDYSADFDRDKGDFSSNSALSAMDGL